MGRLKKNGRRPKKAQKFGRWPPTFKLGYFTSHSIRLDEAAINDLVVRVHLNSHKGKKGASYDVTRPKNHQIRTPSRTGEATVAATPHKAAFDEEEANKILKKIVNSRRLDIYTCASNGQIRYCKTCMLIKPDRTHHCNTCAKCILKMDHHCPWVANCVGYYNYKQFILMLFYSTLLCTFYVCTVTEYIMEVWRDFQTNFTKLVIGIGFVVVAFTGMMLAVLFFYHINLVCRNETTIEALRDITFRTDNTTFSSGKWSNFTEVFGESVCCWFLPVQTAKGNGYEFNVNALV